MIATFVNMATVLAGSLLGLWLHGRIRDRYEQTVLTAVGLFTLVLGMKMALEGRSVLVILVALVLGGLAGTAMRIEDRILGVGEAIKRRLPVGGDTGTFAQGFLDSSVLFCVGPMTVVGSLQAGMMGDYAVIFTKSTMDGFMAIILAGALGAGVVFSVITILLIQGGLTLLSSLLAPLLDEAILSEVSALGGLLILMIGLNLLGLKKIRTADFTPALILIVLFAWAGTRFLPV